MNYNKWILQFWLLGGPEVLIPKRVQVQFQIHGKRPNSLTKRHLMLKCVEFRMSPRGYGHSLAELVSQLELASLPSPENNYHNQTHNQSWAFHD